MYSSNDRMAIRRARVDFSRTGWQQFAKLNRKLGRRFLQAFILRSELAAYLAAYEAAGVQLDGPVAHIGGGALSGKDATKVDRSGAYAARWVAKNIVAAGLAKRCEVQIAYAIGRSEPVSIMVDTFGTGVISDNHIETAVKEVFDLTPAAMIRDLCLNKPIYSELARYGHMGRTDLCAPWEVANRKCDLLMAALRQEKQ